VQVYGNGQQTTNTPDLKLKVLGWILITTIGIAVLEYFNLLGTKKTIQIQAHYMQYTCGENNIDMRVVGVGDKSAQYLVGQVVSPELLNLKQNKLAIWVYSKTDSFQNGKTPVLADFTLVGYVRRNNREHCSGAICFKVEQIKYAGDSTFTKF
jgi:hypothetical protein